MKANYTRGRHEASQGGASIGPNSAAASPPRALRRGQPRPSIHPPLPYLFLFSASFRLGRVEQWLSRISLPRPGGMFGTPMDGQPPRQRLGCPADTRAERRALVCQHGISTLGKTSTKDLSLLLLSTSLYPLVSSYASACGRPRLSRCPFPSSLVPSPTFVLLHCPQPTCCYSRSSTHWSCWSALPLLC